MKSKFDVPAARRISYTRRALLTFGAAALVAPSELIFRGVSIPLARQTQQFSTLPGQWKTLSLPDCGSTVTLGPRTTMSLQFDDYQRTVTLGDGDAFFEIVRDVVRPFLIENVSACVWAVQAASCSFSHQLHRSVITAVKGLITASRSNARGDTEYVDLLPGQQLIIDRRTPTPRVVGDVDLARALAWKERKISFFGDTVEEAIYQMNRVNERQLELPKDSAVRDHRITGTFRLDDPESFWRYLNTQPQEQEPR